MRIQFTKVPTGAFGLAYNVGDTVNIPDRQAKEIVEQGFAIEIFQELPKYQKKMLELYG